MYWEDLDITKQYSMIEHVETIWLREKLFNVEKFNTCLLPFLLGAAKDISLLRQQENETSKSFESIIMTLSNIIIEIDDARKTKEFDEQMDLDSNLLTCDRDILAKNIDLMQQLCKERKNSNIAKNLLIDVYRSKDSIWCKNNDIPSEESLNNYDILTIINIMTDTIFNTIMLENNKDDILKDKDAEIMKLNQELENIRSQFYQNELINVSNPKITDDFKISENMDLMQQINDENVFLKETIKNLEINIKELKEESEKNLSEKLYVKEEFEIITKQFQLVEEENISNKKCIGDLKIKYNNVEHLEQKVVALSEDLESQIDEYFTLQTEVNKLHENEEFCKDLLRKLISKSSESFLEDKSMQELIQIIENIIFDLKALQDESDAINSTEFRPTDEIDNKKSSEFEIISQQLQQSIDSQESLKDLLESNKEQYEKIIEELNNEIYNIEAKTENEIKIKLSLIESDEKIILELNGEISSLKEKNMNLMNEIFNSKNEFENKTKILELELEAEKTNLKLKQEEVVDLLTENKSLEVNYENLVKNKDEIQSKLESSLEEYLKLCDELALIKAQKAEIEKNFENFTIETNEKLELRIQKIESIIPEINSKICEMNAKFKNLADATKTLSDRFKIDSEKLTIINQELKSEIELNQICLNELAAKEKHLTLEMKEKEKDYLEQLREANNEIASQQALVKDLTEENVFLVSKQQDSMEVIEDFKLNMSILIEKSDNLKMEINLKNDIIEEVSRKLEKITEEKLKISNKLFLNEEKLLESKRDYGLIESRLVELESDLQNNKIDLLNTLSEKETAEEELKIFQSLLNEKENLIMTLNNELDNSTKLIENLKTKLSGTADEINQLNSLIETNRNNKELESLKNDFNNKEEQLKKCEHQSLLYSNELLTVKRENDMWTHKYDETHQELQNVKKKFKKEISNLKNQYEILELQLIELKSRSNDEEMEKLKSTVDELNKKVESQKKEIDGFDSLHHHFNHLKGRYLEKRKLVDQLKAELQTLKEKKK